MGKLNRENATQLLIFKLYTNHVKIIVEGVRQTIPEKKKKKAKNTIVQKWDIGAEWCQVG